MSSIHNVCLLNRELLSGDSFVTNDSTSEIVGHARRDVTPEMPNQVQFTEGLRSRPGIVSTPGLENSTIFKELIETEVKRKELRDMMKVCFEENPF